MSRLLDLIGQLPYELSEEGTTGRDLIDSIIYEAKVEGTIEGIRQYAWWKDGVQYVGCGIYTLHEAIHRVRTDA